MNKREYLLTCLSEESLEIAHAVCKGLRFGLEDVGPNKEASNLEQLRREICDLLAIVELLEEDGLDMYTWNKLSIDAKKKKVKKYMQYSIERGCLEDKNG